MQSNIESVVRLSTEKDLSYVLSLSKKETKAIGFIPKPAYEAAVTGIKKGRRWSLTCNDNLFVIEENKQPVGFLLMSLGKIAKVNQICIQPDARLLERGRLLLQTGIDVAKHSNINTFQCGCADDLESNFFWDAMGWAKIGVRKGIHFSNTWKESSQRKINVYRYIDSGLFLPEHFKKENPNDKVREHQ